MANEFKVKNGLIVIGDLTTSGTITINGALAATQSWVTSQAYLTSASLSGYATQSYVTSAISSLIDAAPAALDTLNELAAALGDDANFSTTITNSIASKQSQLNGTGLVRMSGTSVSYDNTTYLISNFGNIEGEHGYGYPSSDGWYKIAEIVLTSSCQSFNLWGEYRDTGYFDNSHYRIHITARAECDFPTNNESHAINVNMYGSSTNETYFNNNVRVVLTSSSSNYRKYELQYYRATWDTGSWNLQTLGWTTYTTSQTAGTPTGTARVYYISKFVADNIYAANKISIGTTYSGFAANIAGTTYVIGASVWVNDGYGISNASSGGTGFFPYSDGTLVFNSVNSEKMRVASSGNVGIGITNPGHKLHVVGAVGIGQNINGTATIDAYGGKAYYGCDGTQITVVGNTGNVGIGTTIPGSRLQVSATSTSTTTADNGITILNDSGTAGCFAGIRLSTYGDSDGGLYPKQFIGAIRNSAGGGKGDIVFLNKDASDTSVVSASDEKMRITFGGNVGIGTSSPNYKLSVSTSGTLGFSLLTYNSTPGGPQIDLYDATRSQETVISSTDGTTTGTYVASYTNHPLLFGTNAASTPTAKMRLTPGGTLIVGDSAVPSENPWYGTAVFGKSGTDKVIAGYLTSSTNGAVIGGHNSGLGAWAPFNVVGSELRFSIQENRAVTIDAARNVGIGTSSPLFNLQVGSNAGTIATTTIRLQNSYLDTNGYYGFNIDAVDNGVDGHDLRFLGRSSPTGAFSELVRIKNTGNVGIGISSPAYKLDVNGETRLGKLITTWSNSPISPSAVMYSESGYNTVFAGNGQFSTSYLALMTTGNMSYMGGNVGIGTTSPVSRFQVGAKVIDDASYSYDSNTLIAVHQTPTSTSTLNDPKQVLMLTRQGTGGEAYGAAVTFDLSRYENSGVNSRTRLDFNLANGSFLTQNTRVMTMLSNGNVGIGTTSPQSRLDLAPPASQSTLSTLGYSANAQLNIRIPNSTGDVGQIVFTNDAAPTAGYASIGVVMTSGAGVGIGDIIMSTKSVGSDAASTERMRINSSGYVGIGTSSPGWKLHVAGESYTSGVVRIGGTNPFYFEDYGGGWFMSDSTWVRTSNSKSVWVSGGLLGGDGGLTIGYGGTGSPSGGAIIAGNVGVGTASPIYKLDVNGNARFVNELYVGGVWSTTYGPRNSGDPINFVDWSSNVKARLTTSSGVLSVSDRKLSLGILDLNSGITPAQYKIKTNIPWNYGGSDFTVNIKGFRYGVSQMVSLSIGWHFYNNEFYSRNAICNGAWAPTISLAKSPDGYVIIYIPGPDYWPKLYIESVYSSNSADSYTSGWSWTDADLSDCTLIQTVPYKDLATNISGNAATATSATTAGALSSMNISQFTNNSGYITGYTETDTLASVTNRGNSTTDRINVRGAGNQGGGNIMMGNVGEGTSKWSYLTSTHYNASSQPQGFALIGGLATSGGNAVVIGGNIYETNPATEIQFWTHGTNTHNLGGTQRGVINSSGNWGIGTTSPGDYKLYVNGGQFGTLLKGGDLGTGSDVVRMIKSDGSAAMLVRGDGKVGIGTSTPSEEFHVLGRAIFDGGSGNSSTDAVVYITKSNNNDWGLYVNAAALDYGMYTRVSPSAGYAIAVNNGTSWTTRITGDGRIYLNEKDTIASYDTWLRLNESSHYGSGVFTPGVMRADGGFQVSGNTVIHSGTIGSQSVSYANNAGYAAEAGQVINQSGQLLRFDNRIISPSETTAGYLQFGFTSWGNDNSSPYADYLHMRSYTDGSGGNDNLVMFLKSGIGMRIYQQTFGSATAYSSYADVWTSANFTSTNVSNWNTAYGWGNHASAGYATTSYVTTQINNLINGAPGVLDTLDELAAALGDDSNFATTVTNSIAGKVSKSGDTMTGNLTTTGLTVGNGVATGRQPYGPLANANIVLNSSAADSSGVCGIEFLSGNNYPSDGATIYFQNNAGGGSERAKLTLRVDNDLEDFIELRAGKVVINANTYSGGGQNPAVIFQHNDSQIVSITSGGQIDASGGNSSQWNTAYGWGNHASAGYALNSSLANYLPLAGGTMSGALNLANNDIQGVGSIYISDPGAGEGINWNSGNGWGIFECPDVFDNTAGNLQFALNATTRLMTLNTAGALWIAGALTEASSLKLKENIETSEGNLEKVVNLRPVTYNKIGSQTTELGLIAEEVAEVYPEFVQYDENGDPIGVNYSRLTAALIGAVKELTNQVQELNKKING